MRVGAELPTPAPSETNGTGTQKIAQPPVERSGALSVARETAAPAEAQKTAQAVRELDLTFRKDANGTTYYVLTNPQTGEVVREVPAKEVRQVSNDIEQYLKSQSALAAHKTDSKA